jgi:hypothetical protein
VARESVRQGWRRDFGYVSLGAWSAWPCGLSTLHFVGQEKENERSMCRAMCTDVGHIISLSSNLNWYHIHVQHILFCEFMRVDCCCGCACRGAGGAARRLQQQVAKYLGGIRRHSPPAPCHPENSICSHYLTLEILFELSLANVNGELVK